MSSRSVSVASSRLRNLRDHDDDPSRHHRRSWSLGPIARKMKISRPNSISLLRRNTDYSSGELEKDSFGGDSRPHSWLGSGIDLSRTAPAWDEQQQLPRTTYVNPSLSRDAVPTFPSPPRTPPPNANGVVDPRLGVLPSPAPTSVHNRSQTDLRRYVEEEPPLPEDAQDRVLRSVVRYSTPPVDVSPLEAVQGEDPGEPRPASGTLHGGNQLFPEEDPDKTLTAPMSAYEEFKKDIEDDGYEKSSDDSDYFGEEVEVGTAATARVMKDGNVSPVSVREPKDVRDLREAQRESEVSPISQSDRNRERFELLAQRQREREQIAQQTNYEMAKEVMVQEDEVDTSDDDEPTPSAGIDGLGSSHENNRYRQSHEEERGSRREPVFNDGSSATAVDEDENNPNQSSHRNESDVMDEQLTRGMRDQAQQSQSSQSPPRHIGMPASSTGFVPVRQDPHISDDDSDPDTWDKVSIPDKIVLTPSVRATQNPTPILERQAKAEKNIVKKPSAPPVEEPMPKLTQLKVVQRSIYREPPTHAHDAVPGAQVRQPQRQPTLLQQLSNAAANGSVTSPRKLRGERYVVRVVASDYSKPPPPTPPDEDDDKPPPPPPKDTPDKAKPPKSILDKVQVIKTKSRVLDVAIPSPSVSLSMREVQDEAFRPKTPPRVQPKDQQHKLIEVATPPQLGDETLVEDDDTAAAGPSSIKRQKHEVEEAMVPLTLHPAMRDDIVPEASAASPPSAPKIQPDVTVTEPPASPLSDDDLYEDHGGAIPPPSNMIQRAHNPVHQYQPVKLTTAAQKRISVPTISSIPEGTKVQSHNRQATKGSVASDAGFIQILAKRDPSRNSISSIESRPMSFVKLPRDDNGNTIERVSTISRQQREQREAARQQEPKVLREQEKRSSLGQLALHQQIGPQQNEFRQNHEPLKEADISIPRSQQEQSVAGPSRHPNTGTTPALKQQYSFEQIGAIEPDISYQQPSPSKVSPKGNRPRHTPIVPIDPSQEHIAYQLAGYREATKRALELKMQADPNFKKEVEDMRSPLAQPTHRLDMKNLVQRETSKPPPTSFFDHGGDRFKLKGKAVGVFKVLKGPTSALESRSNTITEPRHSDASSSNGAIRSAPQRASVASQPENPKKKRFSGMPQMFKRPESMSNNTPNAMGGAFRMFKSEPKSKMPVSDNASLYQNVRPQLSNGSDRPYLNTLNNSGRTSRQSDKYGEGDLLQDDEDDSDEDCEEEIASQHQHSYRGAAPPALKPIQEQPGASPNIAQPPNSGRNVSPYHPDPRTQSAEQLMYDRVSIPAAYDRSLDYINGYPLPRPPNAFEPLTPPTPPSAESPTWRRDPRDPFKGPSSGPPRKFASDSYAAHVKVDVSARPTPSPPVISPVNPSSTPPALRKIFGIGIPSGHKSRTSVSSIPGHSRKPFEPQQQERPWAITLPYASDEDERLRRSQSKQNKTSQILDAPPLQPQQSVRGPLLHLSTNNTAPPGFRFAHDQPHVQQPPPLPGYREVLPRARPAHPLSPIPSDPSYHQTRSSPSSPPPQEPLIPPMQEHHTPLSSPIPRQKTRGSVLDHDLEDHGPSFLSDATPANSAHPSRDSGVFPTDIPAPEPGKEGVPDMPRVPDEHSVAASRYGSRPYLLNRVQQAEREVLRNPSRPTPAALNRDQQSEREVLRNSSLAPQVLSNPRNSSNAPQLLPHVVPTSPLDSPSIPNNPNTPAQQRRTANAKGDAHVPRPDQVALPTSPAVTSPVNPLAARIAPPALLPPASAPPAQPLPSPPAPPVGPSTTVTGPTPSPPSVAQGRGAEGPSQEKETVPETREVSELPGSGAGGIEAPVGFVELSAVPKGEEEDEPVMLGASYPGMEWQPVWEE